MDQLFRGNSTSQLRGHGIGLALTRKILELHRAELTINTKRGVGSRFSIAFGAAADVRA